MPLCLMAVLSMLLSLTGPLPCFLQSCHMCFPLHSFTSHRREAQSCFQHTEIQVFSDVTSPFAHKELCTLVLLFIYKIIPCSEWADITSQQDNARELEIFILPLSTFPCEKCNFQFSLSRMQIFCVKFLPVLWTFGWLFDTGSLKGRNTK